MYLKEHYKKMKPLIAILCIVLVSCNESKTNDDPKNETTDGVELLTSTIEETLRTSPIDGQWILRKINRPWEQGPKYPKVREVWDFSENDTMKILTGEKTLYSYIIEWKNTTSVFIQDSVWVMNRFDFLNNETSEFEIQFNGDTLLLVETCDDCISYELLKK